MFYSFIYFIEHIRKENTINYYEKYFNKIVHLHIYIIIVIYKNEITIL